MAHQSPVVLIAPMIIGVHHHLTDCTKELKKRQESLDSFPRNIIIVKK
jgi:hypothetical protein